LFQLGTLALKLSRLAFYASSPALEVGAGGIAATFEALSRFLVPLRGLVVRPGSVPVPLSQVPLPLHDVDSTLPP
jgi:hypothetical protein